MLKSMLKELLEALLTLRDAGYLDGKQSRKEGSSRGPDKKPRKRRKEEGPRAKGNKLLRHEAVEIYNEDRYTAQDIADMYGVSPMTVWDIKSGRSWSKATGANRKHH